MKVSILITYYNQQGYVQRSPFIDSLLHWNKLSEHKKDLCYKYYKQFRLPRKNRQEQAT